jgi:hypothetical protein
VKRALIAALAGFAAACSPPSVDPALLEREVPGQGDPPRTQAPAWVPDAGDFVFPDAGCCQVRFALAYQGEAAVSLFGFAPPLRPDVPMTLDGGAWETVVCMPRSTQLYGYRAFLAPDLGDAGLADGGVEEVSLFESYAHNPNAPVVMSFEYGLLNEFQAQDAGTCGDLDTGPHGDTSVPDAGEGDGGM